MDHPVVVETFTVPEAAEALGRTKLTFRRWLQEDLIPQPMLVATVRNYRLYSVGELRVIAAELARHEREFTYYATKHQDTRHRIMQALQGYRSRRV